MEKFPWHIKGEILLNCNCDLFCPCVASLGKAKPTYGYCKAWGAVRIESGMAGDLALDGLNVALMLDIPGTMAEGNWTAALYIDEKASPQVMERLISIFKGEQGGEPFVLGVLVGEFLEPKQVEISYENVGKGWRVNIPKILDGAVDPIPGKDEGNVIVANTTYWMSPNVHVSQAKKGRYKDHGRTWDFSGQSAEWAELDWKPK